MTTSTPNPIGAHACIWTAQWDRRGARHAAAGAAAAGFGFIEIPLLDPSIIDVADTIELLADFQLGCTCSLGLPASAHLPTAPRQALAFLTEAIDVAAALGSQWLTGALYGNLGSLTGLGPTAEELDTIARVIRKAATHAADKGIRLGLELINRYETYILNTTSQALALLDRIDSSNVYAHLDTYHMNIEQTSFRRAICELGPRLGYVHLAESHRGVLGEGHVPFDEIFEALGGIGYRGPLVIEALFNADPALRFATATWQDRGFDAHEFATASLKTIVALRSQTAARIS